MKQKTRSAYAAGILLLLAILFVTLTIMSSVFLKGMRFDLTKNGLYTLNEGTRNILGNMDEPVNLYLYFSEDVSRELPQFRSYARWAGEMLEEFVEQSGGKLTLKRVDPVPFSPQEDQAALYGLQGVPVGTAGDTLYFGLVGTNSLDGLEIMPFLQPDKEKFLEYDLAKIVFSLSHPKHKKVGLISGLDMKPGFDPATQTVHRQCLRPGSSTNNSASCLIYRIYHPISLSCRMTWSCWCWCNPVISAKTCSIRLTSSC